ncbi:MAG: sugar-binding domain-containing protein [bacterium]
MMLLKQVAFLLKTKQKDNFMKETHNTISLNGSWKYSAEPVSDNVVNSNFTDDSWADIIIPTNWTIKNIEEEIVWFRKKFTIEERHCAARAIMLHFKGVDYKATVWLNGHKLGEHQGYFQPFSFEVTKYLNKTGINYLVVKVECLQEKGKPWFDHKKYIKGVLNHHDCRPGGAWSKRGQEKNSGGIWQDVYLACEESLALNKILITPYPTKDNKEGLLKVNLFLNNRSPDSTFTDIKINVRPKNFTGQASEYRTEKLIAHGLNEFTLPLKVKKPQLWWTHDLGQQNLYECEVEIYHNKKLEASQLVTFGFREIKVDNKWNVLLNGKKIFLRGTNYISSQYLSEMSEIKYATDIELIKQANCNAVRVHAHVEKEIFYNQCDEAGLFVWQDFPLQWGYSDSDNFKKEAIKQIGEMVELLFNHPAIFLWCCHNEAPWSTWFMTMKKTKRLKNPWQNYQLDKMLYRKVLATDYSRHVLKNSGSTDAHKYPGWYYGNYKEFTQTPGFPLVSEFGAQSLPRIELLEKMFTPDELDFKTNKGAQSWKYHNWQAQPMLKIAKVDSGQKLSDFVKNSQEYQARLIKFAIESYRRAKRDGMKGCFQFMFVDPWPAITWSVVDYERGLKKGYDALKIGFQPVLPSVEYTQETFTSREQFSVALWIINDTDNKYTDTEMQWEIRQGAGSTPIVNGSTSVEIEKNDAKSVIALENLKKLSAGDFSLQVKIISKSKGVLGTNAYNFKIKNNN